MPLLKKIFDKLNGLKFSQEYLCLSRENFTDPLKIILKSGDGNKDITAEHAFIGYKPLIIAIPLTTVAALADIISADFIHNNKKIASLKLRLFHKLPVEKIAFYEGIYGNHSFINPFHQFISGLNNRLFNKRPGNVYLENNLLRQVQIAYAIPRTISLVTVITNGLYNLFPTDLHGEINDQYYIISLRQGGKAAQQVQETGLVLLSEVDPGIYKTVYSLGKNHMQPLKEKGMFPFSDFTSNRFTIPIPANTTAYRELEMTSFFDHGIHRIFLFKIITRQQLITNKGSLAHIHGVYASWRLANNLESNYLIR